MESVWPVSKLSIESVGSRRELVANSCTHRRRDATKQFRRVGVGGVYWALVYLTEGLLILWDARSMLRLLNFNAVARDLCGIVRVDRNCRQQAQSLDSFLWRVYHVGSSRRSMDLQRVRSHQLRRKQRSGDATRNLQRQWSPYSV